MTDNVPAQLNMNEKGIQLRNIEEAYRFATMISQSGMAPKSMKTPEAVLVAIQTGMEAGLSPMRALSSVVVINGVPSWSGKAALALVRASGKLKTLRKGWSGTEGSDDFCAWVETERVDQEGVLRTEYSIKNAKQARLWGKQGPWTEYPDRMLYWRAVGFNLTDNFSDVLHNLPLAEEVQDYPPAAFSDGKIEVAPREDPLLIQATNGGVTAPEIVAEAVVISESVIIPETQAEEQEASDEPEGNVVSVRGAFENVVRAWTKLPESDLTSAVRDIRKLAGTGTAGRISKKEYVELKGWVKDQMTNRQDFFDLMSGQSSEEQDAGIFDEPQAN